MDYGDFSTFGSTSSTDFSSILAGTLAAFAGLIIVVIIIAIISIIGNYKVLKKANKSPVGAFIPMVGQFELCDAIGVNPWWLVIITYIAILNIIPVLGAIAVMVGIIYFTILYNCSLANAFGKDSTGFKIGLILLHPIFICILGFGDAKYIGKNPMNDVIFKNNNQPSNTTKTGPIAMQMSTTQQEETKFCTNCGAELPSDSSFCTSCGQAQK